MRKDLCCAHQCDEKLCRQAGESPSINLQECLAYACKDRDFKGTSPTVWGLGCGRCTHKLSGVGVALWRSS